MSFDCTHEIQQLGGCRPDVTACSASTAPPRVSTLIVCRPDTFSAFASKQFPAGTRNTVAPASRAAAILCPMPPILPTSPSGLIVPVPATNFDPARPPVVSLSITARLHIRPAEGPPTLARLKSTANGAHGASVTETPRKP